MRAFVSLKQGVKCLEQELIDYCKGGLAGYRRPTLVVFLDALPLTGAGKLDKKALKAMSA